MTSTYELLEVLGHGGMADVHRARDHGLERDVAVKVLSQQLAESERFIQLFLAEARKMASVSHPNVLPIFGVDDDGRQRPRLIMELAETTLAEPMASGPCDPAQVERIAVQVLQGLEAIHQAGLVHQDIKPANIFLSRGFYKIGDFGIATEGEQHTQLLATPRYLAPEVLNRPHLVGPSSDLYSLGLVLYEALVGPAVFEETVERVVEQSVEGEAGSGALARQLWRSFHGGAGELPPCHQLDGAIPERLSSWLARMVNKEPAQRFQTCREALAALERGGLGVEAIGRPPGGEVTQPVDRGRPRSASRGWAWLLLLPVLVLLVIGWSWNRSRWVVVEIVSEPPGATLHVADEVVGTTPRELRLRLGAVIELRREGFEPAELTVADRSVGRLFARLGWLPLEVRSDPIGATVRRVRDEAILGRTPLQIVGEGEKLDVRLESEGFEAASLTLKPGQTPAPVILEAVAPAPPEAAADPSALVATLESLLDDSGATAIEVSGRDRQGGTKSLGEPLRFVVRSSTPAHGAVFLLDSRGDVVLLYPSPRGGNLWLDGGLRHTIPSESHAAAGYRLAASEPMGIDRVYLLTSPAPLSAPPGGTLLGPWTRLYAFEAGNPETPALELVRWVDEVRQRAGSELVVAEIVITESVITETSGAPR